VGFNRCREVRMSFLVNIVMASYTFLGARNPSQAGRNRRWRDGPVPRLPASSQSVMVSASLATRFQLSSAVDAVRQKRTSVLSNADGDSTCTEATRASLADQRSTTGW
jgi:hypothetical protein